MDFSSIQFNKLLSLSLHCSLIVTPMMQITQTNVVGHRGKLPFVTAISRKYFMMEMVSLFRKTKELSYRVVELFAIGRCSAKAGNLLGFWLKQLVMTFERPKKLVNDV